MINPTIYWSQDENILRIRIIVDNPFKPPIISFDEKYLKLVPKAFNIEEVDSLYKLEFYESVIPDRSYFRLGVNEISYDILKSTPKKWPKLLNTKDYCPFIQEEFMDNFSKVNESENYDDNNIQNYDESIQNTYRKVKTKNFGRRKKQNLTPEEVKRIYLVLYNLFQIVGFIYILVVLLIRYAKRGAESTHSSYKALGSVIGFLYLIQIQEVLFSITNKTKNGLFLILHLAFKYFIIFIMIDSEPRIQTEHIVFHLLLIYTLLELIKYPYYMLRIFNVNISFITYIRCTVSIILYPIAFMCEGVIMFKNLPYFEETGNYSLSLPNQLNFSFSLTTFIRCYLLIGLFPFLYLTIVRLYYYRLNKLSKIEYKID